MLRLVFALFDQHTNINQRYHSFLSYNNPMQTLTFHFGYKASPVMLMMSGQEMETMWQ
jgi:hypothetical protein